MKVLKQLDLNNVVFLDIETTTVSKTIEQGTDLYESWKYKISKSEAVNPTHEDLVRLFEEKGSLYPEFSKIVCITIGKIKNDHKDYPSILKLKSYCSHDEKEIIREFCTDLNNIIAANKNTVLAGHALKGFDIPFIMRRCMVHQIEPPSLIDTGAAKPWEVSTIDTLELWKGTAFNSASLINIAVALGIPSPKDDIEGADVYTVYYNDNDALSRIQQYCEKDVLTVANIVRHCRFESLVEAETGHIKEKPVGVLEKAFNGAKLNSKEEASIVKASKKFTDEKAKIAEELLNITLNTKK